MKEPLYPVIAKVLLDPPPPLKAAASLWGFFGDVEENSIAAQLRDHCKHSSLIPPGSLSAYYLKRPR